MKCKETTFFKRFFNESERRLENPWTSFEFVFSKERAFSEMETLTKREILKCTAEGAENGFRPKKGYFRNASDAAFILTPFFSLGTDDCFEGSFEEKSRDAAFLNAYLDALEDEERKNIIIPSLLDYKQYNSVRFFFCMLFENSLTATKEILTTKFTRFLRSVARLLPDTDFENFKKDWRIKKLGLTSESGLIAKMILEEKDLLSPKYPELIRFLEDNKGFMEVYKARKEERLLEAEESLVNIHSTIYNFSEYDDVSFAHKLMVLDNRLLSFPLETLKENYLAVYWPNILDNIPDKLELCEFLLSKAVLDPTIIEKSYIVFRDRGRIEDFLITICKSEQTGGSHHPIYPVFVLGVLKDKGIDILSEFSDNDNIIGHIFTQFGRYSSEGFLSLCKNSAEFSDSIYASLRKMANSDSIVGFYKNIMRVNKSHRLLSDSQEDLFFQFRSFPINSKSEVRQLLWINDIMLEITNLLLQNLKK